MKKLFIDFSTNNYRPEEGVFLKKNISTLMETFNKDTEYFFNDILPNVTKIFVSSPNFESRQVDEKGRIKNFFIRLLLPGSISRDLKNSGITLRVNALIKPAFVKFDVKEVISCTNNLDSVTAEKELQSIRVDYRNDKKGFDTKPTLAESCINLEVLATIPYIVKPHIMEDFKSDWEEYLNFELEVIKSKINYQYITNSVEYIRVTKVRYNNESEINVNRNSIISLRKSEKVAYLEEGFHNANYEFLEDFPVIRIEFDMKKNVKKELSKLLRLDIEIADGDILIKNNEFLLKQENKIRYNSIRTVGTFTDKTSDELYVVYLYPDAKDAFDEGQYDLQKLNSNLETVVADNPIIMYTATGDSALYNRGMRALTDLYKGNVKNPWIAGYILEPEKFGQNKETITLKEFEKDNKMELNRKQSEAVLKALNTNDIFLLQGPPGTGKTQTITEMVYHLNKMGKKILLSSQTHVAIDNVLERLPNELDILPLRLLSRQRKENNYTIDKIVENFYDNVVKKYNNKLKDYVKYKKEIEHLKSDLTELSSKYNKIKREKVLIDKKKLELSKRSKVIHKMNESISDKEVERSKLNKKLNEFKLLAKNEFHYSKSLLNIEVLLGGKSENFIKEIESIQQISQKDTNELSGLYENYNFLDNNISKSRVKKIKRVLEEQKGNNSEILEGVNNKLSKLENAFKTLSESDLDTSEIEEKIEKLKDERNKISNDAPKFKNVNLKLYLVDMKLSHESLLKELNLIDEMNMKFNEITTKYIKIANENKNNILEQISDVEDEISSINKKGSKEVKETEFLEEDIKRLESPIGQNIIEVNNTFRKHFNELNVLDIPSDDNEKISLINEKVEEKVSEFERFSKNFKKYENTYKSIKNHIANKKDKDLAIQDQLRYTKPLLDRFANVYGITCTSPDYFQSKRNKYFEELGIGNISLKEENFDVVIIDEVSKATPIEMLIPILYGKSIVLVGDHRQLPPTFKYHRSDLEGLVGGVEGNKLRLNKFKSLIENSLFKQIFTKINESNRSMLNQQYRMHSQIMDIINCFYGGKLELGFDGQDNAKEHGIEKYELINKDRRITLFEKSASAYWFNSNMDSEGERCFEETKGNSTSLSNDNEVKLTLEILKNLNEAYKKEQDKNIELGKPSVGIISTYRLQSNEVRKAVRSKKFKYIDVKISDITTVDEYQGKEKDIIICNMVRNPQRVRSNMGEFVKKYERINVAFSRARKMLCVVGSIPFFEGLQVDIPNNDDDTKETKYVYRDIINSIRENGKVFNNASMTFKGGK